MYIIYVLISDVFCLPTTCCCCCCCCCKPTACVLGFLAGLLRCAGLFVCLSLHFAVVTILLLCSVEEEEDHMMGGRAKLRVDAVVGRLTD